MNQGLSEKKWYIVSYHNKVYIYIEKIPVIHMELLKMELHLTEVMTTKAIKGFGLDCACVDFLGIIVFHMEKNKAI